MKTVIVPGRFASTCGVAFAIMLVLFAAFETFLLFSAALIHINLPYYDRCLFINNSCHVLGCMVLCMINIGQSLLHIFTTS